MVIYAAMSSFEFMCLRVFIGISWISLKYMLYGAILSYPKITPEVVYTHCDSVFVNYMTQFYIQKGA